MEEQQDYTIDQVARITQVHRKTVEKWIREGDLKAYIAQGGRYRIRPDALDQFRENRKVTPKRKEKEELPLAG